MAYETAMGLRYSPDGTALQPLRTGAAGCPFKNESPILTETNHVKGFLDQNRPSRGAGGVRFVVQAKTALRPSFKHAKKTQKSRGTRSQ